MVPVLVFDCVPRFAMVLGARAFCGVLPVLAQWSCLRHTKGVPSSSGSLTLCPASNIPVGLRLVEEPLEPLEQFVVVPEAACDQGFDAEFSTQARFVQTPLQELEVEHAVVLALRASSHLTERQAAGAQRAQQLAVGLARAQVLEARQVSVKASVDPSDEPIAANEVACCDHAGLTQRRVRGTRHTFTARFTRDFLERRSVGVAHRRELLLFPCLAMMIVNVKATMMVVVHKTKTPPTSGAV